MISNDMKIQHQDFRELTKVLKEQNTLLGGLIKELREYRERTELSECVSTPIEGCCCQACGKESHG